MNAYVGSHNGTVCLPWLRRSSGLMARLRCMWSVCGSAAARMPRRAVLLACNDGRNRVLNGSAGLAASLLAEAR